ncbi:MAG TPA: HEAT repeat domain-containing protein [Armatimonadota bacterium]|jgi:hypothetical protein
MAYPKAVLSGALAAELSASGSLVLADLEGTVSGLREGDSAKRNAAIASAADLGAAGIGPVGDLVGSTDPKASRAAHAALEAIVHKSTRQGARSEARMVASELAKLLTASHPLKTRAEAAHLLGMVGGAPVVPALAAQLSDPALREEARLALERIPDKSAGTALRSALKTAPADFRPALEQSLAHRASSFRTIGLARKAQ